GAKFQCERPNFATMKEKYLLALANAGKEASEEAKRQMDKIRREYAARGQTPVFQEGWEENATRMSLIGLEYSVKRDLTNELIELPNECEQRFKAIGAKFLEERSGSPQALPDDILY
ncbi:TPA: hypothetical protein ACOD9S_002610, partial [Stenotrophomonas maltophilia]